MKYNPKIHHRRSIRLKGYDYSQTGAYFVTINVQDGLCLFGEIKNGKMQLNVAGRMVTTQWQELTKRFEHIALDEFIVMPNHIHGILIFNCRGESRVRPDGSESSIQGEHEIRPYGTLDDSVGRILQAFKSITTNQYINGVKKHHWQPFIGKLWQRNYFERIIRNDGELNRIREYIQHNPLRWAEDKDNPDAWK